MARDKEGKVEEVEVEGDERGEDERVVVKEEEVKVDSG